MARISISAQNVKPSNILQTGHLLTLVKRSKEFAKQWLNTSAAIQNRLKSNSTQKTLATLLHYSNKYPYLLREWITNISNYKSEKQPRVEEILSYNETVLRYLNQSQESLNKVIGELLVDKSGSSKIQRRMAFIDRSATAWITLLQPIKLDIFYGFPSERALTEYYTNISKQENFKKYVFSGALYTSFGAVSVWDPTQVELLSVVTMRVSC